jgi:hypothetical protein
MNQPDESSVSEMGEYSVLSWEGPSAAQPCESLMSARRMLVTMLKLLAKLVDHWPVQEIRRIDELDMCAGHHLTPAFSQESAHP